MFKHYVYSPFRMTEEGRKGREMERRREGASKNNERLLSTGKTRPADRPTQAKKQIKPAKEWKEKGRQRDQAARGELQVERIRSYLSSKAHNLTRHS